MRRAVLTAILALAVLIGFQSSSHATLMKLSLSEGSTTVSVSDNGSLDINPIEGVITYSGTIGTWIVNVSTGVTYPVLGSPLSPELDLNSINVSSTSSGTLTVGVSALDYALSPASTKFLVGGTTAGEIAVRAYSGGDYFDETNVLSEMIFTAGAFSGTAFGAIPTSPNPYSLTILTEITHKSSGVSSFDANLSAVPLPGALFLLGPALLGLVGFRKRIFS